MPVPEGYERCAPITDFFQGEESELAGHHQPDSAFEEDAQEHIRRCEEALFVVGTSEWRDVEKKLIEALDFDEWQQHHMGELVQECEGTCVTCPVGTVMRELVGLEPFTGVQQVLNLPGSTQ